MAGKLGWALGLVVLFCIAVLTQAPLAVGLLAFCLLLTLLLALDVRYLRGKVQAELLVPSQPAVQGEPFALTVRLTNQSPLPVPQLLTLVQAADEWGGNTVTLRCSGMLGGNARAEQRLTLRADKSGVWKLRLQSVTLWDHLGLFKAECPVTETEQTLCVLPQSARLGADEQPDPDADGTQESDRSVLGGSYDLREYREGDSLKQVHWKLSAKLSKLLIREPLAAGTMAGQGSGNGPGEGEGSAWGDFPAEAALHRGAPAAKKKAVALAKRGRSDAESGLVFLDRILISPAVPERETLWLVVDLVLLLALSFGLVTAAMTAFALTPPEWVWLFLALWCAAWCLFGRLPQRTRRVVLLAGSLVYLVGLFLCQRSFLAGARQLAGAAAESLNARFNASLTVMTGGTAGQFGLFLVLAALPLTGLLALAALRRADVLFLNLLLLPAAVFLLLAGSVVSVPGWLLLAVGWLAALAASRAPRRRALWGKPDSETCRRNRAQHRAIQKGSAAGTAVLCAALLLPCRFVLSPLLGLPLQVLQPAAQTVESAAISTAITWLPRISGGRLNLHVEAAAGGVADGALAQGGGLQLRGVEDLALTASDKPEETVYLRGFIGGSYDGTAWQTPDAAAFDSASMNWKTGDDARLTIASLPFLRAAYDGTAEPQTLTVERLNAGETYTYAPYNAYWNDYYTINGDGAADGQTAQDDVFLYFPRDTAKELLAARADEDASVLDRMESSYAAYAESRYTAVPDGYDDLKEECETAAKEQKLTDAEDIASYIRTYLNTNCQYDVNAPQAPEGTDPIRYFLQESKSGYSVQFASAATMMFRMFGLPARYVVGYAAPQSLFTQQADGSWKAVLQDDNAHAWAEVYIAGQGWTPMEMTPGVLVTAQEADYKSDLPEQSAEDETAADGAAATKDLDLSAAPRREVWVLAVPAVLLCIALVLLVLVRRRALGLDTRRPCAERVLSIFGTLYKRLAKRGLPEEVSSDDAAFADFLREKVPELSEADISGLIALAQRAAFAGETLTEADATAMRGWYGKIKRNKKT